jgi:N-acetylglucosamine-6-sulfatase
MPEGTSQPNILFVMADDHAANAIGTYGAHLAPVTPTDNIDSIAREGVRVDNCFCTNSICTPSRASILTGQYGHENGVRTLNDDLDPEQPHLADYLGDAGYDTAVVGKWHLGTEPAGFDYYNVLPNQGRYHDPLLKESSEEWRHGGEGGTVYEGYSADVITDEALSWLEERGEDPFFLQCHFKAPHEPWEYADRHADLFEDAHIPEPSTLFEDKSHRSEATQERGSTMSAKNDFRHMVEQVESEDWPTGAIDTSGMTEDERTRAAYQKHLGDYLRTVAAIDENVGRLLEHLESAGIAENTIVVYTSDQGMFLGEHDHIDKRWMYEEPLRMPFVARFPEEIPADSFTDDVLTNVDFAPTILDYAGVDVPSEMQGRSFRANLAGETPEDWPEAMYYRYWMHRAHHDVPAHYGIRTERYKLIFFYGRALDASGAREEPSTPGWELYDLQRDPHEQQNVYDDPDYADVRRELKERLQAEKERLGDTDEAYPELQAIREEHW